jgi:hypothetical protein
MTAEDLWQEFQRECCPPELGESSEQIAAQRMVFLAGVTATIGNILIRPACWDELRDSLIEWMIREQAGKN